MVSQAFADSDEAIRYAECRAHLDNFVRNNWVSFGWKPRDKKSSAHLARVAPVNQYVMDFRSWDESGGIRVFGCFAQRDWFVALTWQLRENVVWDDDIRACREAWTGLFNEPPPDLGNTPKAYLSGNFSPC